MCFTTEPVWGEIKMRATRGSAHYAGLLPVELSDEPPCIRPTNLENDWFQNAQPSLRKRALHALSFLIACCTGVAAAFAGWSYGDAARHVIERSYQQLTWLAPRGAITEQKTPDMVALDAVLRDLDEMRQSIDRIAASQEQITRSIDQIATSIVAGQDRHAAPMRPPAVPLKLSRLMPIGSRSRAEPKGQRCGRRCMSI